MILVDVYVPSIDETYDFQIDEKAEISKVIQELTGMIARKMKQEKPVDPEEFLLYATERGEELFREQTLAACGIQNGDRLLLV